MSVKIGLISGILVNYRLMGSEILMNIRKIQAVDAESLLKMLLQLDTETKFMMFEVNERPASVENTEHIIRSHMQTGSLFLIAEEDGKIVGFLSAQKGGFKRILHSVYIVIGILAKFQKHGIGKELFDQLDIWAKTNYIKRLELTVRCDNEKAISLYKKSGFEIEGTKRNSMCVDGLFYDEYYMAKIL